MTTHQLESGDFVTNAVRLVRPLAEGGMGRVWIAEHLGLHAQVVVKLMAPEMAERPDGAERFAREAAACAAIKSPHVVQVFDHGVTADATPYMVMELLEGKDLGAYLAERGRMEPMDVVELVVQVGKALSKAHKASIIHRDIKPENIFLCDTEGGEIFVKLLDFGTARRETETTSRTTVPGQIMGTPYYMSPEQSVGASDIDERSDIWSLGVVAFEALTGKKPFDGASVGAITIAIHGPLPKLTDIVPDLPPAVDAWFERACAQLPQDRFATAREATNALVEAVTGTAPVDQPTESVCFPTVETKGGSTPVTPVTRPIEPLIASLPPPGSEKRFTTIAAGAVMAVAAAAMIAIVAGRSPSLAQPAQPEAPPATQAAAPPPPTAEVPGVEAKSAAPPTTAEHNVEQHVAPPAERPAPQDEGKLAKKAESAPSKAPAAPATRAAETARDARAKTPRTTLPPQRGSRATSKEGTDDDLVRLSNAATKHAESAPAEPAPSPQPQPAVTSQPEPPPLPAPAPASEP